MVNIAKDRIIVELWPSPSELPAASKKKSLFAEFHASVDSLLHDINFLDLKVEPFTNANLHKGEPVARAGPPLVVELAAWLGPGGIALALYKVLKLWIESKNGRRFKVVDGDLEVEATQLTQDQFVALFELIRKNREALNDTKELKEALAKKGLNPVYVDSKKKFDEINMLNLNIEKFSIHLNDD